MTTKKLIVIIVGILVVLGVLILLFVGGIVGFALYSVNQSGAAVAARDFLRQNETLQRDIGHVKEFGALVTGSISSSESDGQATLNIKVVGAKRTVNATVDLAYRHGAGWRVTAASFPDEAGHRVELLDPYQSRFATEPRVCIA
jgi:hypothetical protein